MDSRLDQMRLFHDLEELKDEKSLGYYGVDTIYILEEKNTNLTFIITDLLNGNQRVFPIFGFEENIETAREIIKRKIRTRHEVEITCNGEKLENSKTFLDYNFDQNSQLLGILVMEIEVFHVQTEKNFKYMVKSNEKVQELKNLIRNDSEISKLNKSNAIILVYDGKIMQDEIMFNNYNLESDNKIFLFDEENISKLTCIKIIDIPQRESLIFSCCLNSTTIYSIKQRLLEITKIPTSNQSLEFLNTSLNNEKTLSEYQCGTILEFHITITISIEIFDKILTYKGYQTSIWNLKKWILNSLNSLEKNIDLIILNQNEKNLWDFDWLEFPIPDENLTLHAIILKNVNKSDKNVDLPIINIISGQKQFGFDYTPKTTLRYLKKIMIQFTNSIDFVFIYQGKILVNDLITLEEYKIYNNSSILMIPVNEGGNSILFYQMLLNPINQNLISLVKSLDFLLKRNKIKHFIELFYKEKQNAVKSIKIY